MRASHVVVLVDILKQHPAQVSRIQNQDRIQTFFSYRPNPTFGLRIRIRRLERGMNDVIAFTRKDRVRATRELPVIVVDKKM